MNLYEKVLLHRTFHDSDRIQNQIILELYRMGAKYHPLLTEDDKFYMGLPYAHCHMMVQDLYSVVEEDPPPNVISAFMEKAVKVYIDCLADHLGLRTMTCAKVTSDAQTPN